MNRWIHEYCVAMSKGDYRQYLRLLKLFENGSYGDYESYDRYWGNA